jgi:hypothetical protein
MSSNQTFQFTGRDSLSQFLVVFVLTLGAGGFSVPLLFWDFGANMAALGSVAFALVLAAGLRSSIVISDHVVTITRLWFFVPYWKYTGKVIEDIWFGGDWGMDDDAMGIVIKIDGQEVHMGSRKTMHFLFDALQPFPCSEARSKQKNASATK